ncbi:MAG: 3-isopropylmalate dehydrogenase [Dehalococcoidia bacterium]|nr:3-isopropylmalate dehydrogenase [Dehalococcoidia bacterium]MDW8119841.1 3-isopropylmalate dehydrogenase [Chloroflexota bacterium]
MHYTIAVLPGDGIGPEVIAEGVRVLEAVGQRFGHTFTFAHALVGGCAIDAHGTPLPDATFQTAKNSDAILFGAVGGPKWDDPKAKVRPEDGLLALRKGLGLFANLRPVKVYPWLVDASPLKPAVLQGVDFIVVRELTGGLYFGKPKRRWQTKRGRRAVDTMAYTEEEIVRILRVGFELARARRKRLCSVDKANILETSRLWREIALELAREYPDVTLEHLLVDTAAMQLVRTPGRFDVIVTENTFGDILTDEAAVLAGSMGMLPSASLARIPKPGERAFGLFEPIHGSAPDIAGKGIANPLATILTVAMLLRYGLGLSAEAQAVETAVARALAEGYRTADLARPGEPTLSTRQMGDAVIRLLG